MPGLTKRDKFAPSQRPYAIDLQSFRIGQHGFGQVGALWAGRKGGVTTASYGHLQQLGVTTIEQLISSIDMRYGGDYEARWDGHALVVQRPVPPQRHAQLVAALSTALGQFPSVPAGYDGWYYSV